MSGNVVCSFFKTILAAVLFLGMVSCGNHSAGKNKSVVSDFVDSLIVVEDESEDKSVCSILVSPQNPEPGEEFRVLVTGGKNIRKAGIQVSTPTGMVEPLKSRNGDGFPFWRIDYFKAGGEGKYNVDLLLGKSNVLKANFTVKSKSSNVPSKSVWKTVRSWDSETEALYSAWINALFYDSDERSLWKALNEVTQNKDRNFLYNHLSIGEDDPNGKIRVLMEPDCADNPYFLRAYFSWKLGLPFGYHECDRGYLGRAPHAGRWITNESIISKTNPVQKFNAFLRMVMNGVHSGSARTALVDETSDYYPVPLTQEALRPGVVFADPYGHTLIVVRRVAQSEDSPGALLSVDAQPDGTVGIKRFWKGNFLFNTSEVIGEPGFKAFRPIVLKDGSTHLLKNEEITAESKLIPFSLQQKGMSSDDFYQIMDKVINPEPLDPEVALLDLVKALHEQLVVRITSVANSEEYIKSHPGEIITMPGRDAALFQSGGVWEDFSTPNRDLRLLIAIDAVLDFPQKIVQSPDNFILPILQSTEQAKENIEDLLAKKLSELSVTYTRSDGSEQVLTLQEIVNRREAFEMAYNPNDGVEIRWGAPENSEELSKCRRHAPAAQLAKMMKFRAWFIKRLHPPT